MPIFDPAGLINFLTNNFIGFIFGLGLGYVTYLLNRKRDDLQWERQKLSMEESHKREREQIELTWKQKLQELQIQYLREDQQRLRETLIRGSDRPAAEIRAILAGYEALHKFREIFVDSLHLRIHEEALIVIRDYFSQTLPKVLEMYERGASAEEIKSLLSSPSIKVLDSTEKPAGLLPARLTEEDQQSPSEQSRASDVEKQQ